MIPRDVAQLILSKLDANAITPSEAKQHAARYRVTITGRTRDQVARAISRSTEGATSAQPALF